ncbi:helix-turn-helix transcriptional regulator [Dyella psychrodurans]|uniref:AlpA family phage regulatory protein n=1 Tax=Dyella psychrodurans TaxID=1927960 RepID=A0A370WXX2_9GAMM|nr:AlpA family phage regulatory protein [Dyella psychrodurans]
MTEQTNQFNNRLIRANEVRYLLGLTRTTFYRLRRNGVIPRPIYIGRGAYWLLGEIEAVIASFLEERNLHNEDLSTSSSVPSRQRRPQLVHGRSRQRKGGHISS